VADASGKVLRKTTYVLGDRDQAVGGDFSPMARENVLYKASYQQDGQGRVVEASFPRHRMDATWGSAFSFLIRERGARVQDYDANGVLLSPSPSRRQASDEGQAAVTAVSFFFRFPDRGSILVLHRHYCHERNPRHPIPDIPRFSIFPRNRSRPIPVRIRSSWWSTRRCGSGCARRSFDLIESHDQELARYVGEGSLALDSYKEYIELFAHSLKADHGQPRRHHLSAESVRL